MKIYIAGPMRGKEWFNFPDFDWAKECLMRAGWEVISPADLDREIGFDVKSLPPDTDWNDITKIGFDLRAAAQRDVAAICKCDAIFMASNRKKYGKLLSVAAICKCDAIFMLHGWSESRGAKAEKAIAEWLGLMVFYQVDGYPKVSEVM